MQYMAYIKCYVYIVREVTDCADILGCPLGPSIVTLPAYAVRVSSIQHNHI